jgi:hypothetical protein
LFNENEKKPQKRGGLKDFEDLMFEINRGADNAILNPIQVQDTG